MDLTHQHLSIEQDELSQLTVDFSATVRTLFAAGGFTETLGLIVDLAEATVEGCDFAGIFIIEDDVVTTPVRTDPIVEEIDALQHRSGEGPCLDAITQRITFYAEDLNEDVRWPTFASAATTCGIRGVLALPLSANGALGALNLYAMYPAAFGVVDRAKAAILATLASQALSFAHAHEDEERRVHNLNVALSSREIIGQAQGILMERERITGDQAFYVLVRASQHLNVKLREVAQDLVDTGVSPETGSPDSS